MGERPKPPHSFWGQDPSGYCGCEDCTAEEPTAEVDPVGTDPLVALGRVRSLHGVTHWCFDPDEQPVVYEPDTQWWPCPTLAAAGVSPPAADEAVAEAVREALADGWDEGFEAAVEWQNSYHHANIGPPDPPMNPHDREARGAAPEAEERR
jgi:hypothetical protein